jgi:hypothetical protein
MSDAAAVYYGQVGPVGYSNVGEAVPLKQLSNLLAFVLVDFAAKGIYRKSFHNML